MRTLIAAIVTSLTAVTGACTASAISLDEYTADERGEFCRFLVACGEVADLATCSTANLGAVHPLIEVSASERAAIDAGRITYRPRNALACIDAIAIRGCDQTSRVFRSEPAACRAIVTGTAHGGEPCELSDECISRRCVLTSCDAACCPGTCSGDIPPVLAELGQSCAERACVDGARCDPTSELCGPLLPDGATCDAATDCAFGLTCVGELTSRSCRALPLFGEPCNGPCRDVGTTCSSQTHRCVAVGLVGDPCTVSSDCSPIYVCDGSHHCSAGLPLHAACSEGQACADDRAFCDIGAGQSMGSCSLPLANGTACERDASCASVYCDPFTLLCGDPPVCF